MAIWTSRYSNKELAEKMLSPAVQFDFKNVTFTFLPHQVNDMDILVKDLESKAPEIVGVASYEQCKAFVETLSKYQKFTDIRNVGAAIHSMIENANEKMDVKSVTFIASTLQDNQILMKMDPGYLANLKALPTVERERLLLGNWKIKAAAGLFFRRTQVGEMLEELPKDVISWCRGWDLAATSEDEDGDPAYTAGVLIGKRKSGRYIVADVINKTWIYGTPKTKPYQGLEQSWKIWLEVSEEMKEKASFFPGASRWNF